LNNTLQHHLIIENIQEYANQTNISPQVLGLDFCPPDHAIYGVQNIDYSLNIEFVCMIHYKVI
jgi:hypothetical protein